MQGGVHTGDCHQGRAHQHQESIFKCQFDNLSKHVLWPSELQADQSLRDRELKGGEQGDLKIRLRAALLFALKQQFTFQVETTTRHHLLTRRQSRDHFDNSVHA